MQQAWQSDHKRWLQDTKKWEKEHLQIRRTIQDLIQKLRAYDNVLDYHRLQIADHSDLMALHNQAMSWNKNADTRSDEYRVESILDLEDEAHKNAADLHRNLSVLHDEILCEANQAGIRFSNFL